MLNGGISVSAIRMVAQVTPQPRHSTIRKSRAWATSVQPDGSRSAFVWSDIPDRKSHGRDGRSAGWALF